MRNITVATCTSLTNWPWDMVSKSYILWILAYLNQFCCPSSRLVILIKRPSFYFLSIGNSSRLFKFIWSCIFTGKLFSLWMTHLMVFYKERWVWNLFWSQNLDKLMFRRGGRYFLRLQFSFQFLLFSHVLCFVTKIFVQKVFFDRRYSSLFEMLVHVNVGYILPLIIFQVLLIFTGLTTTMIFRTWDVSLLRIEMMIHWLFFIRVKTKINYTKRLKKKAYKVEWIG